MLKGQDAVVIANGNTGAGKTYFIEHAAQHVTVEGLAAFETSVAAAKVAGLRAPTAKITAVEVYNETLIDLLAPGGRKSLAGIFSRAGAADQVPGLTEIGIASPADANDAIRTAMHNRSVGATLLNARSSRSHAVIQITIESVVGSELVSGSTTLVDLAGSESAADAAVEGDRLEESKNINKSILALRRYVAARAHGDRFAATRDSMLTRLLKRAFEGTVAVFVACINPAAESVCAITGVLEFTEKTAQIQRGAALVTKVANAGQSEGHIADPLGAAAYAALEIRFNDEVARGEALQRRLRDFEANQQRTTPLPPQGSDCGSGQAARGGEEYSGIGEVADNAYSDGGEEPGASDRGDAAEAPVITAAAQLDGILLGVKGYAADDAADELLRGHETTSDDDCDSVHETEEFPPHEEATRAALATATQERIDIAAQVEDLRASLKASEQAQAEAVAAAEAIRRSSVLELAALAATNAKFEVKEQKLLSQIVAQNRGELLRLEKILGQRGRECDALAVSLAAAQAASAVQRQLLARGTKELRAALVASAKSSADSQRQRHRLAKVGGELEMIRVAMQQQRKRDAAAQVKERITRDALRKAEGALLRTVVAPAAVSKLLAMAGFDVTQLYNADALGQSLWRRNAGAGGGKARTVAATTDILAAVDARCALRRIIGELNERVEAVDSDAAEDGEAAGGNDINAALNIQRDALRAVIGAGERIVSQHPDYGAITAGDPIAATRAIEALAGRLEMTPSWIAGSPLPHWPPEGGSEPTQLAQQLMAAPLSECGACRVHRATLATVLCARSSICAIAAGSRTTSSAATSSISMIHWAAELASPATSTEAAAVDDKGVEAAYALMQASIAADEARSLEQTRKIFALSTPRNQKAAGADTETKPRMGQMSRSTQSARKW